MNLQSLNQKWHGVPIWAWAILVAVIGFFVYRKLKDRGSGGSSNSSPLARIREYQTEPQA
jgi:hypothetical protein